jgi:hypothetical protein
MLDGSRTWSRSPSSEASATLPATISINVLIIALKVNFPWIITDLPKHIWLHSHDDLNSFDDLNSLFDLKNASALDTEWFSWPQLP